MTSLRGSVLVRLQALLAKALDEGSPAPERETSARILCETLRGHGVLDAKSIFLLDEHDAQPDVDTVIVRPDIAPARAGPSAVPKASGRSGFGQPFSVETFQPRGQRKWVEYDPEEASLGRRVKGRGRK